MSGDWIVAITGLALALGVAACVMLLAQGRKLRAARSDIELLTEQLIAAQELSERDLLAMGQRVMEADKLVRRLTERLDALENTQPIEPRYGQLESLLSDVAQRDALASQSEAEEKLLALLRRAGS